MTSSSDVCLIPSGSGGRAASTSGELTSSLRSSCVKEIRYLDPRRPSFTASSCSTRATHTLALDSPLRIETEGESWNGGSITCHHCHPNPIPTDSSQHRSCHQQREHFPRPFWLAEQRVNLLHHLGHQISCPEYPLVPTLLISFPEVDSTHCLSEENLDYIQSRGLKSRCPDVFPGQHTDRRWNNTADT